MIVSQYYEFSVKKPIFIINKLSIHKLTILNLFLFGCCHLFKGSHILIVLSSPLVARMGMCG